MLSVLIVNSNTFLNHIIYTLPMAEEETEITIEDLELSLEVYEIESEQKLTQLKQLFTEKGELDLAKMFYEQRSSIQIKFQSIIGDLIEFLVKQEVATTEKLRKTFYRVLENPLLLLFKVSRFEIFDLRLNGFDIELQPIQAIAQLAKNLYKNIDEYIELCGKDFNSYDGKSYKSWDSFLEQAFVNLIQDKLFVFYSYLRKGSGILKKKFENKVKIVEIFNNISKKLLPILLQKQDSRTIKELSLLNYEIYELENSFDVLYFYMNIPLKEKYKDSFQQFELLANKAKQSSNYNLFILQFVRYGKDVIQKLEQQKVDEFYKQYIQNALKCILEMWGCRICYYKQFCDLFTVLFRLYSNQIEILEFCMQHTPDMKKDDIVLLRTNFKLEMDKKHSELLSLMKKSNLEEINDFLNSFYHRTFYNLNFKQIEREKIITLLTLINGNSSLSQFFHVTEKAFKEWNHSIDFSHSHKFIETEYAYPKIGDKKVRESLNLLTNLCALEQKGFQKDYETLIKGNTIGKAILGLAKYLKNDERCGDIVKTGSGSNFIVESFHFVKKCLNPSVESENLVDIYSGFLQILNGQQHKSSLETGIIEYIRQNIESFHISTCLTSFSSFKNKNLKQILRIFLEGINDNNGMVRKFKYLDAKFEQLSQEKLSEEDSKFIQTHFVNKNGIISFKDSGIFKLSDLQVMTNPIQFDKVMDNFYFNLDSNAKKFVQYISTEWNQQRITQGSMFQFYTSLLYELIREYPICTPLLASIRLPHGEGTKRFVEMLCLTLGQFKGSSDLLIAIIQNRCIRYRNGRDYVQEEIVPMATKQIIQRINNSAGVVSQNYWVLSNLYTRINLAEFKLDTIQKSIDKIRFAIKSCDEPKAAVRMSEAYEKMMTVFFEKKQRDMRKVGLKNQFINIIWNQVRNYASNSQDNQKQLEDVKISEHIIVTPFTISQDFNISEYKIKKMQGKGQKKLNDEKQNSYKLKEVAHKLPKVQDQSMQMSFSSSHNLRMGETKKIDLRGIKYDIKAYLGASNIERRAQRDSIELILNDNKDNLKQSNRQNEDLRSFIQFYMKQLQIPAINHKVILQDVVNILKEEEPSISHLWTNGKNLQYYFMNLFSIFEFAALDPSKRQPENDPEIKEILSIVAEDSQKVMKKVLSIFRSLGYSNIWAESLNIFWNNFPIRKFLGFNAPTEESILSIILKHTLENQSLKESLTDFLGSLFQTREEQNALMYKVTMDRTLMNTIMKSLSLKHLDKISLMFHSNFNNLRLYTDQLHEGLKALNIASKNRSYNQFIKLSKSVEDQQFYGPMKLFKQNFSFFIRIEKEGYMFKKNEETKLALDRLTNVFRNTGEKENVTGKVNEVMEGYIKEITELQGAIANRIKSFYLVTKLRDLSYQNSLMIPIIHEVMKSTGSSDQNILAQIQKVQVFSLLISLYNQLVRFQDDWRNIEKHSAIQKVDGYVLENQITFCTTRRFAHSMSKVYQKCDLQFDEVIQRCFDGLKTFFVTEVGNKWLNKLQIYPAFLTQSFIGHQKGNQLSASILSQIQKSSEPYQFEVNDQNFIESLAKGLRQVPRKSFSQANKIKIGYKGQKVSLKDMLGPLEQRLRSNETLICLKNTNNLIFNKYKSSEATLEQIEILGYIISYSLLNNIPLGINLHPSIVSALSFNISQLDYLLDINFTVWEQLRNILSTSDCAGMTLNFSYLFQSLETFKPIRVELVDKGSSKKVNNLNREQYCDLVCCYILYEEVRPQVTRLLETILSIVPKDFITCLPTKKLLSLFYDNAKTHKILDDYMKKIGVVLPETLIDPVTGKRYESLKDFQNVNWLQQVILENPGLRAKYWPDESNLFVVTAISGKGSIRLINNKFLIQHFGSKEELKAALSKL